MRRYIGTAKVEFYLVAHGMDEINEFDAFELMQRCPSSRDIEQALLGILPNAHNTLTLEINVSIEP